MGLTCLLSRGYLAAARASSRSTRFSTGGCVLNRDSSPPPVSGLTMNMCAVAGVASIGTSREIPEIFSRARARESGFPQNFAPDSSARYSRERDTAIWISIAPSGATIEFPFKEGTATLAKLLRLRLVEEQEGRYRAVPVDEALVRLDEAWDQYFTYHNERTPVG